MGEYQDRINDINIRAGQIKKALFFPVIDDTTGRFIGDKETRCERIQGAISGTVFEQAGENSVMIAETASNAIRTYCNTYGEMPRDEVLASTHKAIENAFAVTSKTGKSDISGMVLEAAEMSTTEGIILRDRLAALIMPYTLNMITSRFVNMIPGDFNKSEIFKVYQVAGSTFGGLTKGDVIDQTFNSQYTSMDQRVLTGTGDGTDTGSSNEFRLTAATAFGKAMPFKKGYVKVYHDYDLVATDETGTLIGSFTNASGTAVTVTGTIDYATGVVDPLFSVAPANGIKIHVGVDIDIEKDPTLIPLINHTMDSKVLRPHESAISAGVTLQSLWTAQREYGFSLDSQAMVGMRNLISADKDRKILNDMRFFAKGEHTLTLTENANDIGFYYKAAREALLYIDSVLRTRTKVGAFTSIVGDKKSVNKFIAMGPEFIQLAPGYVFQSQPHYVGRIMGMYDLYCNPNYATDYKCLCIATGPGVGESGYVAGDAIPPLAFKHAIQTDLNYKSTLWGLAYRDLNPFSGRDYFMTLNITVA
jgi:hypothetical protein